jgi:ribosomal-protein-alanine N-acetyltransferase
VALRKLLVDPSARTRLHRKWRAGLPELHDASVTLRELRCGDARSLVAHLNTPRVLRFIARCPSTEAGFVRFIHWTHKERSRGAFACYGIVPRDQQAAVGVVQVWPLERDFSTAEWGFVIGERHWGTGLFMRSAHLALDAFFAQLGIYRLEARAVDVNVRGNRVLETLGATREGVLYGGFRKGRLRRDHIMWSILAPTWRMRGRNAGQTN